MIIPALLTTNERIAAERIQLAQHMSGWLHIDMLDQTLYQFRALSSAQLQPLDFGELQLELHCMVNDPTPLLESGLPVGRVVMHYEIPNRRQVYDRLTQSGTNTWMAIDPNTDVKTLDLPNDLNGIMVMGVIPGQTGQSFLPDTYDRLHIIRDYYPDVALSVDGGVSEDNVRQLLACGVDNLVVGSAIFNTKNPVESYQRLAELSDPITGQQRPFEK